MSTCTVNPISSSVCMRGTHGCDVIHADTMARGDAVTADPVLPSSLAVGQWVEWTCHADGTAHTHQGRVERVVCYKSNRGAAVRWEVTNLAILHDCDAARLAIKIVRKATP